MLTLMNLYAVFDTATESTGFIFESSNDKTAIRSTIPQIKENCEDFKLVRLGEINHSNSLIKSYPPIVIYSFGEKKMEE